MPKNNRKKCDFSGYATKFDLRCSDGRVIRKDAFSHNDGTTVPLVWQHQHDSVTNVLGHAVLENRSDGVYAYGYFNHTENGEHAKQLVKMGDISRLSIHATKLRQQGCDVLHGDIKELSLVMAGANPGAVIDNVTITHSDGSLYIDEDQAIILCDEEIKHSDEGEEPPMDGNEEKVLDLDEILDSLDETQADAVASLIEAIVEEAEESIAHAEAHGGKNMPNLFEQNQGQSNTLSHADRTAFATAVFEECKRNKTSFRESFLMHAKDYGVSDELFHGDASTPYGIENIEILFPDAKIAGGVHPTFIKRRTEWVSGILSGAQALPFNRIKTRTADLTPDAARARGYMKGNRKYEEVFAVAQRTTTPTTIYKKQKLDRDDITDITDFDVVAWVEGEMRLMIEEEIARAALIGDGRDVTDESKINETNIRPIWKDDLLYTTRRVMKKSDSSEAIIEHAIRAVEDYEGSGSLKFYTTKARLNDLLLQRDKIGRRLYATATELAHAMGVNEIVEVPLLKDVKGVVDIIKDGQKVEKECELYGIMVNIGDYAFGSTKGGKLTNFSDFDIDFNQYKYLIETRLCGALLKPKTAVALVYEADDTSVPTDKVLNVNVVNAEDFPVAPAAV